jgi:signal transduction histidine kinase
MRFHLSVQQSVFIGVGVIGFAGIASMLVIYNGAAMAQRSFYQVTEIEQPITNAAYEMEINATETGNGVLAYLDTGQSYYRKEVIKESQEFARFHAEYVRLAESPEHYAMALSSSALFRQSLLLGQKLMALKDQQDALISTNLEDLGRISAMIQHASTLKLDRVTLATLRVFQSKITQALTSLTGYLHTRQTDKLALMFTLTSQERNALWIIKKSNNSALRRTASEIITSLDLTMDLAYKFMAVHDNLNQDILKFLDLRRQLDNLFAEHTEVLNKKGLALAVANANQTIDNIVLMSSMTLPLSQILSIISAIMMLKMARRPIKALKERASEILDDSDLCKRLSVRTGDEFCSLAEHFNLILDQLESTTVSKDKLELVNIELRKEIVGRETMQRALSRLSSKLMEAQESERRHIARELHDHIGQSLTALKINLESLKATSTQAPSMLKDNLAIVVEMLSQVRSLSLNLRPPLLDDLGLVPALRWHLDQQAQRSGFKTEFTNCFIEPRPQRDVENTCFRIFQEALTNISRHAQACHVRVSLEQSDKILALAIRDNGIGFDVASARQNAMKGNSLGLLGMEERAQLMGGHIQFLSAPGQGTEIRALLPVNLVVQAR